MANLIKRIAVSQSHRTGNGSLAREFASSSHRSVTGNASTLGRHSNYIELSASAFSVKKDESSDVDSPVSGVHNPGNIIMSTRGRTVSFAPKGFQIKKTEEVTVSSEPIVVVTSPSGMGVARHLERGDTPDIPGWDRDTKTDKSLDGTDSVDTRRRAESDDEAELVEPERVHFWAKHG